MEQQTIIAGRILDDMSDGVMTINLEGQITTLNPAAARILGISQEEALSKRLWRAVFVCWRKIDDF